MSKVKNSRRRNWASRSTRSVRPSSSHWWGKLFLWFLASLEKDWGYYCAFECLALCSDVQYVFKHLSRYPKTFSKFAITSIIIPFNPPQFVSYFTFSSVFPFLYHTMSSSISYLHSSSFSYAISHPFHLYPLHVFFYILLKSFENHSKTT